MKVSTTTTKANPVKAQSTKPVSGRRATRTGRERVHDLQHTVGNRTLDRLARSVVEGAPLEIQRKCSECEQEEEEL